MLYAIFCCNAEGVVGALDLARARADRGADEIPPVDISCPGGLMMAA
jgi:hypothetical protein